MDMGGKDNFETEKPNDDPVNYHSPNMSSDWRYGSSNFTNTSMGLISNSNPMALCKGDLMESSSCSSASMVDSFCPPIWDHPSNSTNLPFSELLNQNNGSTSNSMGIIGKGAPFRLGIERTLDVGWTQGPNNSMLRGGVGGGGIFLPTAASGMLPQSLSQFPADSGFIERAARFSSFSGGNFGDVMNPFGFPPPMQGSQEIIATRGLKSPTGVQSHGNDEILAAEHGSPLKNESFVRSHDEAKQSVGVSGNESDEAEFSSGGGGGQDEPSTMDLAVGEPSSIKGLGSKKRKRSGQDSELDHQVKGGAPQSPGESPNENMETQRKGDQNPGSTSDKPSGKHGKQGSQASDAPKEDYIHVRARRGQATNSHSLAERVRREKISERMKFLQDLVPGCSKVTGKAVMLDEIINYVQSLQRQVEFLSMKLATVNPRLDFNIDGLLAKDSLQILQSRAGPSPTLGFSPDMTLPFPQLHQSQPGMIQAGLPMGSSSDVLRRAINPQFNSMSGGGFKDPTSQVPNPWEDELNTVVQMGFNPSAPPPPPHSNQDLSGTISSTHP